ncbi:MAG: hypothetical protein IJJ13_07295, partial [Lachnospiraceae bacterium]|nr:hypothetical protein [Lachnospiraceae bacterium]
NLCEKCKILPEFKNFKYVIVTLIKRYLPYIVAGFIIALRFSIAILGVPGDHYSVKKERQRIYSVSLLICVI